MEVKPPDSEPKRLPNEAGIWVKMGSPGDLVVDLYAGLAPMARACLLEGRRYVGAEIDPARHAEALARLAQVRA